MKEGRLAIKTRLPTGLQVASKKRLTFFLNTKLSMYLDTRNMQLLGNQKGQIKAVVSLEEKILPRQ